MSGDIYTDKPVHIHALPLTDGGRFWFGLITGAGFTVGVIGTLGLIAAAAKLLRWIGA